MILAYQQNVYLIQAIFDVILLCSKNNSLHWIAIPNRKLSWDKFMCRVSWVFSHHKPLKQNLCLSYSHTFLPTWLTPCWVDSHLTKWTLSDMKTGMIIPNFVHIQTTSSWHLPVFRCCGAPWLHSILDFSGVWCLCQALLVLRMVNTLKTSECAKKKEKISKNNSVLACTGAQVLGS